MTVLQQETGRSIEVNALAIVVGEANETDSGCR